MDQHFPFIRNDVMPSWWANAIQRAIAVSSAGLRLTLASATSVQVPAGAHDAAVMVAINGKWRYNETTVTRAHPGGAAGDYAVFAVAAANDVRNLPLAGSDFTNYAFDLRIVAGGSTPTPSLGVVDIWRQIATVHWTGTAISSISQDVGACPPQGFAGGDLTGPYPAPTIGPFPAGRVLTWGGDTNLYRGAAATLETDGALIVGGTLGSGMLTAFAAGSTASSSAGGTNWLRAPKNTVAAFIGNNDDTSVYAAGDFSGALRFNGAGTFWGDISYSPRATNGPQFTLYADPTSVGSGSRAMLACQAVFVERAGTSGVLYVTRPGDADYRVILFSDCSSVAGGLQFGTGATGGRDTVLWRAGTSALATNGSMTASGFIAPGGLSTTALSAAPSLYVNAPGDTNYRLICDHSGSFTWSPGNAGGDIALYRASAGIMGITGNVGVSGYVTAASMAALGTFTANTIGTVGLIAAGGAVNVATELSIGNSGASSNQITLFGGSAYTFRRSASGRNSLLAIIDAGGSTNTDSGYSAGLFETYSDRRLKENVTSLDGPRALRTVCGLRGVKHGWKGPSDRRDFGFIAQEVAVVAPDLVSIPEDASEMWGVDYMRVTPLLVEATKHIADRVEVLEGTSSEALEEWRADLAAGLSWGYAPGSAQAYDVQVNGDISATGTLSVDRLGLVSDSRLLRSARRLGRPQALEALRALHPVSYMADGGDERRFGLIAQEVERVLPSAVHDAPDPRPDHIDNEEATIKVIDIGHVLAHVIAAVQELDDRGRGRVGVAVA